MASTDTFFSALAVENGLLLSAPGKVVLLNADAGLTTVFTPEAARPYFYPSRLHPGQIFVSEENGHVSTLHFDGSVHQWVNGEVVANLGKPGFISGMAESAQGDLWLGTGGSGLSACIPPPVGKRRWSRHLSTNLDPCMGRRRFGFHGTGGRSASRHRPSCIDWRNTGKTAGSPRSLASRSATALTGTWARSVMTSIRSGSVRARGGRAVASGVPAKRVAEGLGITTESLRAWRRQLRGTDAVPATAADGKLPAVAPTTQELPAEVRRCRAKSTSISAPRTVSARSRSLGSR